LFENEVSTYFLEQSLRNENEQLRLRLQALQQQYTQLQTQHTQARQATAPTTASPSTTATPTPQPAAQQTRPQLVWNHKKSFFGCSDSHIRVYYKSLTDIMQSMA
jgi:type II secretory pathway pseudopilin PulG